MFHSSYSKIFFECFGKIASPKFCRPVDLCQSRSRRFDSAHPRSSSNRCCWFLLKLHGWLLTAPRMLWSTLLITWSDDRLRCDMADGKRSKTAPVLFFLVLVSYVGESSSRAWFRNPAIDLLYRHQAVRTGLDYGRYNRRSLVSSLSLYSGGRKIFLVSLDDNELLRKTKARSIYLNRDVFVCQFDHYLASSAGLDHPSIRTPPGNLEFGWNLRETNRKIRLESRPQFQIPRSSNKKVTSFYKDNCWNENFIPE